MKLYITEFTFFSPSIKSKFNTNNNNKKLSASYANKRIQLPSETREIRVRKWKSPPDTPVSSDNVLVCRSRKKRVSAPLLSRSEKYRCGAQLAGVMPSRCAARDRGQATFSSIPRCPSLMHALPTLTCPTKHAPTPHCGRVTRAPHSRAGEVRGRT